MKKNLIFGLFIILFVCGCVNTSKPKNLIPEDKMIDILYDMNMFQSIRSNDYKLLNSYDINPQNFIYQKYDIDSLQLSESHKYYISNIDNYQKIIEKLIERAEIEKDSISKQEEEEK